VSDEIDRLLKKAREDGEAIRRDLGINEAFQEACEHPKTTPPFDAEEARKLNDAGEVRKKFPRFFGQCPDCGAQVIGYASYEHYIMGDW